MLRMTDHIPSNNARWRNALQQPLVFIITSKSDKSTKMIIKRKKEVKGEDTNFNGHSPLS
jgi:hypothetical protein